MFNFIVRKIFFKDLTKEQKFIAELTLTSCKMALLANILLFTVLAFPFACATTFFITSLEFKSVSTILIEAFILLGSLLVAILFIKSFFYEILLFRKEISLKLYLTHIFDGDAISIDDFDTLKEENKSLYNVITNFKSSGFCYHVCFELLKTLKKGTFWFVATKWACSDEENSKTYTMHALYENSNWCYDTYSMKQHPFDFALEHFGAKKYLSFSYEDIKDLTFYEFREKTAAELKAWCEENDCYEEWSDFSQK